MVEPLPLFPTPQEVRSRCAVRVLGGARPVVAGLCHRDGLLPWERVLRAHAAEVGEPQGVRAVIFDLVFARDGPRWRVRRFGAEPGDEAARQLSAALPTGCLTASLESLASDGTPGEWHPAPASLDESGLVAVVATFG